MATRAVSTTPGIGDRARAAVRTVADALCVLSSECSQASHAAVLAQRPRHGLAEVRALYVGHDKGSALVRADPART